MLYCFIVYGLTKGQVPIMCTHNFMHNLFVTQKIIEL